MQKKTPRSETDVVRLVLRVPAAARAEMERLARRDYLRNAQAWAVRQLARAVAEAGKVKP